MQYCFNSVEIKYWSIRYGGGERWYTFFEGGFFGSLSIGENSLHVNSHVSFRGIPSADDAEAQTLLPATFLVGNGVNVQRQRFRSLSVRLTLRCCSITLRWQGVPLRMRWSAAARCADFYRSITIVVVFCNRFQVRLASNNEIFNDPWMF